MNSSDNPTPAKSKFYSIVIADDDRSMASLLAANLHRLGHRVVGIAWDGKEAVAMALKKRPDAVIMDINMPILDGIQAAREIRSVHPTPIVLSSGLCDAKTLRRAVDLDLLSYLVKPFGPEQLKVALNLAVTKARLLAQEGPWPAPGQA
jgi:response regulator NasT